MSVRLDKPWRPLAEAKALPGQLGVFELGNDAGEVVYIGAAGGHTLFGLRSAVTQKGAELGASSFRVEVTSAYHTRRLELLMVYRADHGTLPEHNAGDQVPGRLSPA